MKPLCPRLERAFYNRDTRIVARELLGKRLVRQIDGLRLSGRIVETEVYTQNDAACHASRGRTPRTEVMFGPPGHAYIYFIYGMHHCFNVVTEPEGTAAAALIRALAPVEGRQEMLVRRQGRGGVQLSNGPAKLCYALGIDRSLNRVDLTTSKELWIEEDKEIAGEQIARGPRIGVRGDERALNVEWRFWVRGNEYVSR